jgi:hypothetical protein
MIGYINTHIQSSKKQLCKFQRTREIRCEGNRMILRTKKRSIQPRHHHAQTPLTTFVSTTFQHVVPPFSAATNIKRTSKMNNHQQAKSSSSSSSSQHEQGGNNDLSLRSLLARAPTNAYATTLLGIMPPAMTRSFLSSDATALFFSNQSQPPRTPEEHKANLARILQAALDMVDDDDDDWIMGSTDDADFASSWSHRPANQQQDQQ